MQRGRTWSSAASSQKSAAKGRLLRLCHGVAAQALCGTGSSRLLALVTRLSSSSIHSPFRALKTPTHTHTPIHTCARAPRGSGGRMRAVVRSDGVHRQLHLDSTSTRI
jgi:hypothetical protein